MAAPLVSDCACTSERRTGGQNDDCRFEERNMKAAKRSSMYLPMAALILAALAISAAAQQQVPFKGTFQGNDNTATHGTIITTGTGIGALVGHSH
jgi:hypothetical protein